jgi:hypothetical protein
LRLSYIEGALLATGADLARAARVHAALAACFERVFAVAPARRPTPPAVEQIAAREGATRIELVCAALATCKAHALLVAEAELDLEPRAALALAAGMPARGGPSLVAFARAGQLDPRLLLLRADAIERVRALGDLAECARSLDNLLVAVEWL